ncbi:ATP-binding protein [Microvirga brassicacearum]|uniref:histidine kinase n=1 Tax=Microvirga brassicacearum TaxID=2580413 RepID=A0A5N3PGJ0_9HYPH|nr:ATP-binding protein [Microvirga brassicacearum]KAB0268850.1 response regulator [Microvirga brassicacearum]
MIKGTGESDRHQAVEEEFFSGQPDSTIGKAGRREKAALVDLLFRQSRAVLFANLIIPIPVAYVLWEVAAERWLLLWIATIWLLTGVRILLSHRYFADSEKASRAGSWARHFTVLSIFSSLLWGAIGWIGFVPQEPHFIAFVCIVLTGMSGGAIPSLSAYPPAYIGLLLAMQIPFALRCIGQGDSIALTYLAFQACLVGVYLYYCRETYIALMTTVRLRFENLSLIEGLEHERDRATAADQAKTRFLAAAGHDLRQPIHAIGLFTATLAALAKNGDVSGAEARDIAGRLQLSVGALGRLLHGLLDISRIEAGLVSVERQPVSLSQLLAQLCNEFTPRAEARGIRLRVVNSGEWACSDPALLKRILDNFVTNALKYTPAGGVLIGCRRRGQEIAIQVVDTGFGIPADRQVAAFDEFTRLHESEGEAEQGLGLGLAIVRRLATLLEHPVTLASIPGRGSVFSIRVPVIERPVLSAATTKGSLGDLRPAGIMIVDDDPQLVEGLKTLLSLWGHQVYAGTTAADVHRHHKAAGRPRVDLIIADYRLSGGLTGTSAIADLAEYLGYAVPALIVTGDTSPERLRKLTETGHALLHKPVDPDVLYEAIDRTLSEGSPIRPEEALATD